MTSALVQDAPLRGYPGQKAQANRNDDVVTAVNQSASGVEVGCFVTRDVTQERACKVLTSTAEGAPRLLMGLVLRILSREPGVPRQYEDLSLMREGYAYVTIEDAHEIGDPVYVRCVATGGEKAGAVRASADGTDCVRVSGVILSTGGAGALGLIFFNINTLIAVDDAAAVATSLNDHIVDATAAHAASAIAFTPAGAIAATTVQAALVEVDAEKIAIPAASVAGDILYHNGTSYVRLPKGTAGQVLTMNAGATAPEWQTP